MKTLAEKIAVMQAAARGERIEADIAGWAAVDNPTWDWGAVDYRVAQKKPREFFVVLTPGGVPVNVLPAMDGACSISPLSIRVREVIDEIVVEGNVSSPRRNLYGFTLDHCTRHTPTGREQRSHDGGATWSDYPAEPR